MPDPHSQSRARSNFWLVSPTLLMIGVFMVIPLLVAVAYSFMTADAYGGVRMPFTPDAYLSFFFERDFDGTLQFTDAYVWVIVRSVVLASLTVLICLAIGLPVAWHIVCQTPNKRSRLLFLITMPFWINTLIRTYCWVVLLRDQGLVNNLLEWLGLIDHPIVFLYNDAAVLLGLVYTFVPFMVLPIYTTLERMEPSLIEAGYDLYAGRWQVFRRIIWPVARPGAATGAILVFVPGLSSFLQPDLLGGGRSLTIGSLIQLEFTSGRNWSFGSALSIVVTALVMLGLYLRSRRGKIEELAG